MQVAIFEDKEIYAFTRPGDIVAQDFARQQGAVWAGDSLHGPPGLLDAAIIFAADGPLVPRALTVIDKGGMVICAGIHMSDIPTFPYSLLWEERRICSVANLTRADGNQFLELVSKIPLQTTVQIFDLQQANEALNALRSGKVEGAAVLAISP